MYWLTCEIIYQCELFMCISYSAQSGFIKTPNEEYIIEPIKGHEPKHEQGHPHILYKRMSTNNGSVEAHVYRTNCGTTGNYINHVFAQLLFSHIQAHWAANKWYHRMP